MDHLEDTPVRTNGGSSVETGKNRTFMLRGVPDAGEGLAFTHQPPVVPTKSSVMNEGEASWTTASL